MSDSTLPLRRIVSTYSYLFVSRMVQASLTNVEKRLLSIILDSLVLKRKWLKTNYAIILPKWSVQGLVAFSDKAYLR